MESKAQNIYTMDSYKFNQFTEFFETLFENKFLKIEKIISEGHSSEPDFWFDQETYEWVILLRGRACLRFKDKPDPIILTEGDYLLIKPHEAHRVEWTAPNQKTIWLAIHFAIVEPIDQ